MPALLADIGGTNARFALLHDGVVGEVQRFGVADFPTPEGAIAAFLAQSELRPSRAALAVAGPVAGGRARLTNGVWQFDEVALSRSAGFEQVRLVNDFAALALSLPALGPEHLRRIGGGEGVPQASRIVLGPGTGLGVAGLLSDDQVVVTEGGHMTLPAVNDREAALLAHLRRRMEHVSAEDVLSGSGLVALYEAVVACDGLSSPHREDPADIVAAAQRGECPASRETLSQFFAFLGGFAGNLALAHGARCGVYLGGGILPRVADLLAASRCRARFEAKGRMRDYLAAIPLFLIEHPDPCFLGLARMVDPESPSAEAR